MVPEVNDEMRTVVWREGKWFVAQCLDIDIASQGRSEHDAVDNLREAVDLHYTEPLADDRK